MTQTPDPHDQQDAPDLPHESTAEAAGQRGEDDRKQEVNPADRPAPRSPEPDEEAIRKAEDSLNSVSPH